MSLRRGNPPDSSFPPPLTQVLADLSCVPFRRRMDAEGRITYPWVSDNVAEILGFAPEDLSLTPKGALNALHWADRDGHVEAIRASAATRQPCREHFRAITAGGETRWFRGSASVTIQDDGSAVWDGVWMDVSPLMQAENRFQTVMDHAGDCILKLDSERLIKWVNAATERQFGWRLEEMQGRRLDHFLASPLAGADGTQDVTGRHQDGRQFPFELTMSEVRADGTLSLIVIGRDITERKAAERAIRDSEERFRLAFAAASLGIVVTGLDGTIRQANPAFVEMCRDPMVVGRSIHDFLSRLPGEMPAPGNSFCLTHEPVLESGEHRNWRVTGAQFSAASSDTQQSLLLLIEDTTDIVRANEERRQLEQALQEGQKLEALGRLAGGVAHELNNMLGPILMAAEMLARTAPLDDKNRERCARIIEASKHGRDIVRNVLAYCRKESKILAPVDLVPLLHQFAALAGSVMPPSIKLETRIKADAAWVSGDASQLTQILLNLANNARDAMGGIGGMVITLELGMPKDLFHRNAGTPDPLALAGLDQVRPHAALRLADTGSGMPPEAVAKIFDPFFTTKPVGQGTGLGLSVVQGIVKNMGGAIAVDTAQGQGTTFHIVLPLIDPPEQAIQ